LATSSHLQAGDELLVDCSFLAALPRPRRPAWFSSLLDARTEDGCDAQQRSPEPSA